MNLIKFDKNQNQEFDKFISENKEIIYETTPLVTCISNDDEWVNESEWNDFLNEL